MTPNLPHDIQQRAGAPPTVRRIALVVVGLMLTGAGYLIAVRGEAIVVDLATLGANVWCF